MGVLLRSADSVVVVTVANVSGTGSAPVLTGRVLRTIKGSLRSGADVRISTAGQSDNSPLPRLAGRTCVWFLKQTGSLWTALPVMAGSLSAEMACIAVPAAAPQIAGMTPEDALAAELLGALDSDETADQAEEFLTIGMADVKSGQLLGQLGAMAASHR